MRSACLRSNKRSPVCRSNTRTSARSFFAAAEQYPCFVTARLTRSIPSGVRGPVERPPCMRHRPFGIAGHRHGTPCRFLAPQRGAFRKSPGGFPFLSQPRRCSWGPCSVPRIIPHPPPPSALAWRSHSPDNRLATRMDVHVFDDDFLLRGLALQLGHGLELLGVQLHQACGRARLPFRVFQTDMTR